MILYYIDLIINISKYKQCAPMTIITSLIKKDQINCELIIKKNPKNLTKNKKADEYLITISIVSTLSSHCLHVHFNSYENQVVTFHVITRILAPDCIMREIAQLVITGSHSANTPPV